MPAPSFVSARLAGAALAAAVALGPGAGAQAREVPDRALDVLAQQIARGETHVAASDLAKWLVEDRRDFVLVDVRTPESYAAGHVKGAVNVALPRLFHPDTIDALENAGRVILYADAGESAAQAAAVLRLAGVNAYALRGGYVHWVERTLDPRAAPGEGEVDLARRQAMARSLKDCPRLPVAPTALCASPAAAAAAPGPAAVVAPPGPATVAAPPGPATVAAPPGPATIAPPPGPSTAPGAAPAVPILLEGGCG